MSTGENWRIDKSNSSTASLSILKHLRSMGKVHTHGLENFWSLLKDLSAGATLAWTVPSVSVRRRASIRYNNRKDMTDSDRFDLAVRQILGRRLTWAEVTGKIGQVNPA